ncbi:hypothetical protein DXG03_004944 [Asterophora parasitica]|uniref:Chromatin modification-related protein EAF7 n=1 Tax=Asterophora parasitica TaxID=117018 RepID=A0A9P7GJY1_9AGAR|nr:hypothetical protein DXG03_004944 [Asterophora parasitica]
MTVDKSDSTALLKSVEGEISFFRSMMRTRPVGIHRHFHVLAIQNAMFKDTGRLVDIDDIWEKLRSCYDLDALEAIVRDDLEAEGYESPKSTKSTPISIRSPSPSQNLAGHPFFREEFSLPFELFESLISQRRVRDTESLPSSSPEPASPTAKTPRGGKKRGLTELSMAGLVGGDSDSSALTQESGDEGGAESPRGASVVTATDLGTDHAEDEDVEIREPSIGVFLLACIIPMPLLTHFTIAPSMSPKPTKGRGKATKKATGRGRGGAAASTTTTRPAKKRKR